MKTSQFHMSYRFSGEVGHRKETIEAATPNEAVSLLQKQHPKALQICIESWLPPNGFLVQGDPRILGWTQIET